jgi:hypothetical protein
MGLDPLPFAGVTQSSKPASTFATTLPLATLLLIAATLAVWVASHQIEMPHHGSTELGVIKTIAHCEILRVVPQRRHRLPS